MQRRATIAHSRGSVIRVTMNAYIGLLLCGFVGSAVGYYPEREAPYNTGPNDPYSVAVNPNFIQEPSQRIFWDKSGKGQGSNQVGGTGFWAMMTNKFPFLGNMFGRMELPTQYGVPSQYDVSTQYGAPARLQPQVYQAPAFQQQLQQQFAQQFQQQYPQQFQQQYPQQFQRQIPLQSGQNFVPFARDVGLTDDAVIVTPPQVPVIPPQQSQPPLLPQPLPVPEPAPGGYQYNEPQYRLELPHK